MSLSTILFLLLRPLHVLLAAIWIGSAVFMTRLLMPVITEAGPQGGQIMVALNRKGMNTYFGILGGLTTLTGIYLYWRFTGGFGAEASMSHAGIAFGIGGACGILAVIIGGSVVGRTSGQLVELMEKASRMSDGPEKGALMATAGGMRHRIEAGGRVVLALQVIALVLMAVGHYI